MNQPMSGLPATGPTPPGAPVLVDCDVCDGTQVMTARPADHPDAPPAPIPCPRCGGAGVRLVEPTVSRG